MSQYIPEDLRTLTAERGNYACEYCLISQEDTFHTCHIDHIISLKHGGKTIEQNLAFACQFCNRNKGSDGRYISFRIRKICKVFQPKN